MRFEDLKRVWREEASGESKRDRIEDLLVAHGRASTHLNRLARFEIVVVIVLLVAIVLFGQSAINAPRPLLAWSGAVLIWGWLVHAVALLRRLRKAKPDPGLPVRDAIHAELERLRLLEWFRATYLRYLIPTFIVGLILYNAGLTADPRERLWGILSVSVLTLVVVALGIRWNRQELEGVVRPLREELESWTADLEKLEMDSGQPTQEESDDS